jgi:hypothetical protein
MFPISSRIAGSSSSVGGIMVDPSQAIVGPCRQQHRFFAVPESVSTARAVESQIRSLRECEINELLRDSAEALVSANTSFCGTVEEQSFSCAFHVVHGEHVKAAQPPKKPTTAETVCSQALGLKKVGTTDKAQLIQPKKKAVHAGAEASKLQGNASTSHRTCTRNALAEAIMARCASRRLQDRHDGGDQV